jgi:glucosamine--fructose-6-phosphate aminotransferase (isomerizing)
VDKDNDYNTLTEIFHQPIAWQQAIEVVKSLKNDLTTLWENNNFTQIIFTGCGSTYYLALAAASITKSLTDRCVLGIPAGELVMYPNNVIWSNGSTLLIAISRSAETSETISAVKVFKEKKGGKVIVITNYPGRVLSNFSDVSIEIPYGQEKSVAQTQSFSSMYIASIALALIFSGRPDLWTELSKLPEIGQCLLERLGKDPLISNKFNEFERIYFLGSGLRYGLACEASLKMKEMSLTHSEPFHFLEFRHGPISMVNENTLVIGLVYDGNHNLEYAVLQDVIDLGGSILSIGEIETDISFQSGLSDEVRNVLYLPVLQLIAYYRARKKLLNPDEPKNLKSVVHLNL